MSKDDCKHLDMARINEAEKNGVATKHDGIAI